MAAFDFALVTGKPDDRDALARQIADFANGDETGPVPGDNNAWVLDVALRELEKGVSGAKLWHHYANICGLAVHSVTRDENRALVLMAQMNGARRVPEADWKLVAELIAEIDQQVNSLQSEPHKRRLVELLEYHRGIVARYVGDYDRAVRQQHLATTQAEASGNTVGAAIAHLCEWVEQLNAHLSRGEDPSFSFDSLHEAARRVVMVCTNDTDPTQVTWTYFNAPVHVLEGAIWSGISLDPVEVQYWTGLLDELQVRDSDRYPKNRARLEAIRAGLLLMSGDHRAAHRVANEVVTTLAATASPEALSTARIVLAITAAMQHLAAIKEVGGHMHQLLRMAEGVLSGDRSLWPPVIKPLRKAA